MTNSIDLTVAGVHFSIGSDCEIVGSCPSPAYDDFVSGDSDFCDVNIPVTLLAGAKEGLSKFERCFDSGDMWSLFRDGETRHVVHTGFGIESPMWAAEFPLDASSIRIHCGETLLGGGARLTPCHFATSISSPMRYPLDQILMTYVLARCLGVLLHSAGVLCNGKLWLLAGKSRAGKSTSAALLKGRDGIDLLSDDRVVVRKIGDEFIGYGTPWPGEAKIATSKSAPLAGILFLDQSSVNQIDEIRTTEAFERLMPVASVPWYEPELFPEVMEFCGSVAKKLPMHRLQFRPDIEAAEMLEKFMKIS